MYFTTSIILAEAKKVFCEKQILVRNKNKCTMYKKRRLKHRRQTEKHQMHGFISKMSRWVNNNTPGS